MDDKRILLVEDDPSQSAMLTLELKRRGFRVESEKSAPRAVARLEKEIFDAVVTDLRLGEGDGLKVVAAAKASQPETGVVVITGHGSIDTAVAAMKAGAYDYLTKPIEPEELALVLRKTIEHRDLLGEVRRLRAEVRERKGFTGIVSASPEMRKVLELVSKVAVTDATVLVTGESGTGKELIARAIHENSPRRDGSFVALNCGALPEGLLESELFGHVKGSFTGADRNKRGLFEEASGGTLFLDEISETTPGLQVKLLRALQEGEIRRVGDNHPVKVSARVVAASNRDLKRFVSEGKFREDLYYRLKVFPIELPALRERPDDVMPLAETFLQKARKRSGAVAAKFSPAAAAALRAYAWPGNVRELEHAVERALIMASGPSIEPGDLPPEIGAASAPAKAKAAAPKKRPKAGRR
ncbi:MAG: sigma-54 dependent transcriptional regulator [Elusimicrobiota bacterium]|nr:sigma-54 dependent transcriptional regulator [Elusimicrobiota bacterium]